MDSATFAAQRAERLVVADDDMRSIVAAALQQFGTAGWADDIVEGAAVLWLEMFEGRAPDAYQDAQLRVFQRELAEALEKTADPGDPPPESAVERITKWVGTYTVNNATYHGGAAAGYSRYRWVSMRDNVVRETHRAVSGTEVRAGGTFQVGTSELRYPGEPVGDPANWIECRCLLQPVGARRTFEMATPTQGAPVEVAAPTHAGLAVRALDTGRVLMLQRALDDNDGGMWEFPGGSINDGETPDVGAAREWAEEVGMEVPVGTAAGSWLTPDGVYAGFVLDVEAEFPIHEGRDNVGDPEETGEQIPEAIAWWSPADLVNNPVVRAALRGDLVETVLPVLLLARVGEYDATEGETMPETITAAATAVVDETVEPMAEEEDRDVDEMVEIPFHGVAAPIGKRSGDGRQFGSLPTDHDAVTHRALPLPMMYQAATSGEPHGGATRVGRIDNIWIDEENLVRYAGFFNNTPDAARAIEGLIFGDTRSVSVDLGGLVLDAKASTDPSDRMAYETNTATTVFSLAEIAAITMVPVGAFSEAYIALGEADCGCDEEDMHDELDEDGAIAAAGIIEMLESASIVDLTELSADELDAYAAVPADQQDAWLLANHPDAIIAGGQFAPGTKDGPGWITNPQDTARIRRYWTHGEGAAKIRWGVPGDFNRCRKQLAKYIKNPDWLAGACANMHKEALGVWPGEETGRARHEAIVASGAVAPPFALVAAGPVANLPRSWFEIPEFDGPTLTTITPEGRVYGHLATWESCHIGIAGVCTAPPSSPSKYAFFHTGMVETDSGDVAVGHITMGIGHADLRASAAAATAHYDQSNSVVADIVIKEDAFGIGFAGAIRPNMDDEKRREFKATGSVSGDWRKIGGEYELVGVVVVGTPGFPIANVAIAASGGVQTALVAAGVVTPDNIVPDKLEAELGIVHAAADEVMYRLDRRDRITKLREKASIVREARLARVKGSL